MSNAQQSRLAIREEPQPLDQVEKYQFEPIKGYPMLNWKGKRPFTSTQYYPAQIKESHGPEVDGWRNKIYWGDNLQVMSHLLKEYRSKVQLIYIDPPFDSKADYKKTINVHGMITQNDIGNFEEKQYTDIWTNDEYLQFLFERLVLLREMLCDEGSIYVHCDWHRGHYIRCILDEIFGAGNFLNEIIWKRASTIKGNFGQGTKGFGANTDTIFFYSKTENVRFYPQYLPYSEEYIREFFKYFEPETNRRYRLVSMIGPGGATKGNPYYEIMGIKRYWRYSQETMQELVAKGLIVQTNPGAVPQRKQYLDEGKGVSVQNLWADIEGLGASSSERVDYPTQKPEALLDRIIKSSSKEGDLVFDCFMGSGTTQTVAMKLGRRFIGADINLGAVQITTKRLLNLAAELQQQTQQPRLGLEEQETPTAYYSGFEIYNVNHYDIFRNPLEAKDLLLEALEVQRLEQGHLFDGEKDGRMVKIMPVNRIATCADLSELIAGFDYKAFERRQAEKPKEPVEKITLVCMGHEPNLAAALEAEVKPFKLDVEVVDILRDKQELQFKRDSEAKITAKDGQLTIEKFYPMNLLQKLSLQQENVDDWRELVESVMVDWNYDGAILTPTLVDVPEKDELVKGKYPIPDDAGTIRVKITDLLSESLEVEVPYA